MLLAACGVNELAREENGQGNFTSALLELLREREANSLTYNSVLQKIKKINGCAHYSSTLDFPGLLLNPLLALLGKIPNARA